MANSTDDGPSLLDDLGNGQSEPEPQKVTSKKQTLPRDLDSELDTFGDEPQPLKTPKKNTPPQLADEDMPEFDQQTEPAPKTSRSTATLTLEADEPADEPLPLLAKKPEPARLNPTTKNVSPDDEGFSEPVKVNVAARNEDEFDAVPQRAQKPVRPARRDEFAEANFDNTNQPSSPTTDLPPARTRSSAKPATDRHPLVQEGEYLVESGENFCVICKKLYGSEKYYLALAEHNRNRVADPCRMQPGLVILAPSREVLETQHARLIPKPKVEVEAKETKPHSAKKISAAPKPAGLFLDEQGAPWYRVGKGDTLQAIARNHLGLISRAGQIFNLNRERLADPDDLRLGQELRLPNDASQVRLVHTEKTLR